MKAFALCDVVASWVQSVTIQPSAPWYTLEVADERRKRWRLERKWLNMVLQIDRDNFVHQFSVANNLIDSLSHPTILQSFRNTLMVRRSFLGQ